jgi:tRNA nucleotidyltransferase (CCA-adding enzyme)
MEIITTHINADFDALGSMIAAKRLYPDAVLAFPGGQEKTIRNFLVNSAMYMLDIEKASKISLDKVTRLILVDIRQAGRLGKFAPLCSRAGVDIHIYDHHPPSTDDVKGSHEVVLPYGATTTIMCSILQERHIVITPDEATVMMLGIYEDTGSLTFSSTTQEDFKAAAYLLAQGANLNIVADMVIKDLTAEQVVVLNDLIENASIHTFNGIDVMITRTQSSGYVGDFAVLVHKLKNMENVNVLFALANMDDRIYIVGRSRIQEVNAAEVLAVFGGGGHATAASATVHDMTLTQVEQKLIAVIQQYIRPVKVARDFMVSPVKTIDLGETLDTASSLLTRYNINVVPVTDKGRIVGLISRQILDKARHHGLKGVPVREYMTTEFATVRGSTPMHEIKQHIIHGNQRFLPIVDRGKITGAITRTDLLRVLHVDQHDDAGETEARQSAARKTSVKSMLVERLPRHLLQLLRDVGMCAESMGYHAYAVGGFVRDIFLRVENLDVDIVIEGDGIRFARAFSAEHGTRVKVFKKFGTAVIDLKNNEKLDVASARLEYYEKPAALPKVEWSSIKLDLYRRDFTINTLAIRLNPRVFGDFIDFFGARRDIKERAIRVLHNLSFVEDPSRIFRAIRFEQRFDFHLSKLSRSLIENAVKMDFLKSLSGKRIFTELTLLLSEEKALPMVRRMHELRILKYIHPDIQYDASMRQLFKNISDVLSWYALLYLDNTAEKWLIFLFALLDRVKPGDITAVCRYFDINKKYRAALVTAKTTGNDILCRFAQKRQPSQAEIYGMLNAVPLEVCLFLMARTTRPSTKKFFSLYFTQLRGVKLHVTGDDLIKLGIPPGRIYTKILDSLLEAALNGKVAGRDEELRFIRKKFVREIPRQSQQPV